jgi:hypothetical protein
MMKCGRLRKPIAFVRIVDSDVDDGEVVALLAARLDPF